jgi:hypothetical protein
VARTGTGPPTTPDALALIVMEMLGLGLPRPDHLQMSLNPGSANPGCLVMMQFNRAGKLAALQAWADRFDALITERHAYDNPGHTWKQMEFTNSGVRFVCYAPPR